MVKTEMAEGDRDELTVLVPPKQDQATVGLGGGGLAEPLALPWATLTALAGPGGSAGPSDPNYSDQMLTWTRTPVLSPELRLGSISASNSKEARPFPSVAQFPQMHKGCISRVMCNCEALDGDLLKVPDWGQVSWAAWGYSCKMPATADSSTQPLRSERNPSLSFSFSSQRN